MGTYAFRSLLDASAILTFGSDWTVAPLSPILGIYAAVTRRTIDGKNPKGWIPQEKITVEEALRAYTGSNAWAMFAENEVGAIKPEIRFDERIYEASPQTLVQIISELGEDSDSLLLVGHNPGLTDFANRLSHEPVTDNIPTCGIIGMRLPVNSWKDAGWGKGAVVFFDYPKNRP